MELLDTDYSAGFLSSDSPLTSDQLICVGIVGILKSLLIYNIRFNNTINNTNTNYAQETPLTQKWFSGKSCIRSNWNL